LKKLADIAPTVERLTCNQFVAGSTPAIGSMQDGLEVVPAQAHNLNDVGSTPTPASTEGSSARFRVPGLEPGCRRFKSCPSDQRGGSSIVERKVVTLVT
jgi:hypothetical protein